MILNFYLRKEIKLISVNNLLSVYELTGLLNFVKKGFDVLIPILKCSFGSFICLVESDLPFQSVDLGFNPLITNHIAKLWFGSIFWDSNQFRKCWNTNFWIVLVNNSQVVLDQLSKKVPQMGLVIFSIFSKWLELWHFGGYLVLTEWHQLVIEKFVNISGKFGAILKTTSVVLLNDVHHINFLIIIGADEQENDVVLERSLLDLSTFICI